MVPQDPVLFSGTLRSNVDPFAVATDEAIWSALERVGLRSTVSGLDGGLSAEVSEREWAVLCVSHVVACPALCHFTPWHLGGRIR